MRLGTLPQTYRSLRRLRRIISVLFKYGFDDIVERLGLGGKPFLRRHPELRGLTTPQRLKLVFEDLGPTFIKFGQVLSTRSDVVPTEFVAEFRKLQDTVPPMPRAEVRRAVETALAQPLEELFAQFDFEPRAAASIAQVHEAVLPEGRHVVVKLQRLGVERLIEDDSAVLMHIAQLMERHGLAREFDPRGAVAHFRKNIRKELDFTLEGQNMDRFRANFAGSELFLVPEVIWSHSGRRLLTMERLEGIKVSERERLIEKGHHPALIAARLAEFMARQVVSHGLFHADPHPGNIFVMPGDAIGLIDYGLVGRIDDDMVRDLVRLAAAVVRKDGEALVRALLNIGFIDPDSDLRALQLDLLELIDRYAGVPLGRLDMQTLFEQSMAMVRAHHISMPSQLLLLAKAAALTQAVCRDLDPGFEPLASLSPLIRELATERVGLSYRAKRLQGRVEEVVDLLAELPRETRFLLRKLHHNRLSLNFEHRGLEGLIDMLDRSSNRVSFSLIIAALIIGSSVVLQSCAGPRLLGLPLLAIVGFLAAGVMGFGLAVAILRSGKL